MDTKQIMTQAWNEAREAVAKFGGRAREYFASSLRNAWKLAKLLAAGGKLWQQHGKSRIYFNGLMTRYMDAIGLTLSYYKTGNISTARIDGELISNCGARRLLGRSMWDTSKLWFDLDTMKWGWKDMNADDAKDIIEAM